MADRHEQRGFLDDSRLDNVPVKAFETSLRIGNIIESQKKRETETAAESNIDNGKPHEATDTQGDWKRDGIVQCKICGVPQNEGTPEDPQDFRYYKKEGVWYRCTACRDCETNNARRRRFSHIIPIDPYPKRLPLT